jgi:urea transport system substrate-binding protein
MTLSRRRFLVSSAIAAPWVLRLGAGHAAAASADIKIGGLYDVSGLLQLSGRPKSNVLRLAVDETNAAGGLLGRNVNLMSYDTQSNNQLYSQYAQQLALSDNVSTVFGALSSAAREIVRPIFDRGKIPYFYTMGYEGGVCDRNTFMTGATVSQSLGTLIPYAMKRFGKKVYILGADYIFGQISDRWIRKYVADGGGQIVGSELFPLDASNFSSTIAKIQSAAPDFIVDSFVTPPQYSFYSQWAAVGMKSKIPIASQTFGSVGQHRQLPGEITEGIIACYNYFEEADTQANRSFVKQYQERFGKGDYLGHGSASDYVAWKLWSTAVERAGSLDREAIIQALQSNLEVDTVAGRVRLDPAIHHCVFEMHILEIHDSKFRIVENVRAVSATEMGGQCDLLKSPSTNKQFQPAF